MTPQRRIKTLFFRMYQQYHRCFYCGADMTAAEIEPSLDHVIPKSRSRMYDAPENCVACCYTCNQRKGAKNPSENEKMRLAELNKDYSDSAADAHYVTMLKTSPHLNRVLELCGIQN